MRNPTYSKNEVIEAAIELQRQNKNVTGYSLVKHLGGGRPDRLMSIWDEYLLTQQEQSENELNEYYLSSNLRDEFDCLSSRLIKNLKSILIDCEKQVNSQAEERIKKEQLICKERLLAMEENLKDANSVINQQEDNIEELLSKQNQFSQDQNTINELEKQLAILNARIDSQSESIKDKERVIIEQEARINDITRLNPLLLQESDLKRSEV